MKFFGWIQHKLSGVHETKPSTTFPSYNHKKLQETREEFSDWPYSLLAIGTFGSKQQYPSSPEVTPRESLQVVTSEEVGKLQEMRKLLARNEDHLLPLDRFLQKMFACRGGFAPAPSPRDILQVSRMEKFLRTLLHKKMYPRNCSRATPMKTCTESTKEEEEEEKTTVEKTHIRHGSNWVRTNSDYIVLEL